MVDPAAQVPQCGFMHGSKMGVLSDQPRGMTTPLPLIANKRAEPGEKVESQFAANIDEPAQVAIAGEIELPFLAFMKIPGDAAGDAVQSSTFRFQQSVPPEFRRATKVVN